MLASYHSSIRIIDIKYSLNIKRNCLGTLNDYQLATLIT